MPQQPELRDPPQPDPVPQLMAVATGANEDALYRVLRLLASLGVFEQIAPQRFAPTPAAALLPDPMHLRIDANLMHSVTNGGSAAEATWGMPVFDYRSQHPDYSQIFNRAMTAFSAPFAAAACWPRSVRYAAAARGGHCERTAEEFPALLAGTGLRLTRIVPTKSPLSVIEATRE
ncbi:MAG TPA: hypothetical protein VHX52_10895 [Steroidobacteraceae bacterium]|jgi:hypothetical protein|nr:hypothetical protein [Steroidobacteraceae bacterium]